MYIQNFIHGMVSVETFFYANGSFYNTQEVTELKF